ncbi:MAG: zinc ribbon domain-containing protein [Desulfomonilaceae bacterium]|nr:zinc ribbon domain-containing protein [Desulfomonilaceae bacterium]
MPIYEYQSVDPEQSCRVCRRRFEVLHGVHDEPLSACPDCGSRVVKVISWCRAVIVEPSPARAGVETKISEFEKQGMWSHAAELSDTYAEKAKDEKLKTRAFENYQKAGYDVGSLVDRDG